MNVRLVIAVVVKYTLKYLTEEAALQERPVRMPSLHLLLWLLGPYKDFDHVRPTLLSGSRSRREFGFCLPAGLLSQSHESKIRHPSFGHLHRQVLDRRGAVQRQRL